MTIEWWRLPENLGGHRTRAEKAGDRAPEGYYAVTVPGWCNPAFVHGTVLIPELPTQPAKGSIVLGRQAGPARIPWAVYVRLIDTPTTTGHHWARADNSGEMYTWQRIHKDHSEVLVLVDAGAEEVDWRTDSVNGTRVELAEDDDDGHFVLKIHNPRGQAVLPRKAMQEMATTILSRLLSPA